MRFSLEQKSHFSPFLIIQLHGMHSTLCCIISTAVLQRNSGTQWPAAAIGSNTQQLLSTYSKNLSLTHSNSHPHPNPVTPTSHTGQTSEGQGGQAQFQRITEWLELEGTLKTIQLRVAKLQLTRSNCPGPHSTQPWIRNQGWDIPTSCFIHRTSQVGLPAHFLKVHSGSTLSVTDKDVQGAKMDPWETPLVSSLWRNVVSLPFYEDNSGPEKIPGNT